MQREHSTVFGGLLYLIFSVYDYYEHNSTILCKGVQSHSSVGVRLDSVGNGREKEKGGGRKGEWGIPRRKTRSANRTRGSIENRFDMVINMFYCYYTLLINKNENTRPRGMCGDRGMLMTEHQVEVDWWNTATERRKGKMVY